MKILVLDNYDSFTYNLVYQLRELGFSDSLRVARNDKISLEEVAAFDKILLSPGPGLPADAGIMPALIRRYAPEKSILGICLGHQGIGEAFGSRLYNRETVLHGIATPDPGAGAPGSPLCRARQQPSGGALPLLGRRSRQPGRGV
jgi:anthranilate synthase component 2